MKALVGTFNQEKTLVGAFFVITDLRVDLRFKLYWTQCYGVTMLCDDPSGCIPVHHSVVP